MLPLCLASNTCVCVLVYAGKTRVSGFLRGVFPALVGIFPAILSHGLVYFMMKQVVTRGAWSGERHGDLTELLCTSAAILAQNIVTNPIGMIQTRMQVRRLTVNDCI